MAYLVGVDVGGTFTDSVVMDEKGVLNFGKAASTPPDFASGVLNSVAVAAESMGIKLENLLKQTILFCHSSTVATNTMLTRSGAKTGLITTEGFEDTIILMRLIGRVIGCTEEEIKHMVATNKPEPLIPKSLIKGVKERVDYKGEAVCPLIRESAERAIKELVDQGVEAIAVCLLWSFINPAHEREIQGIIRNKYPDIYVTLSCDLVPKLGEYERTAATAINAYVGPTCSKYLSFLAEQLKDSGFKFSPLIMQSYGGCLHTGPAAESPVGMIASGPAAGIMASMFLGQMLGYENIITTDVGGTSFDVGLIYKGIPQIAKESSVGQYSLMIPSLEVRSIGSGGGSIAWVESVNGLLKVGPRSAGAMPGPACYDLGGTEPTVTDANLVLGYLNPDYFLGGRMKLNKAKALEAIEQRIARPLGMSIIQAALSIYEITNAHMLDLVRNVTVGCGYDPREFVLFAYGGAGPLHAATYGNQTKLVIVPYAASVHSALGTLTSDMMHSYQFSDPMVAPFDVDRFNKNFGILEQQALGDLRRDGFKDEEITLTRYAEMRYVRQINELRTPVPGGNLSAESVEQVFKDFEKLYEELYGKGAAFREAGIHLETFIVEGRGRISRPSPVKRELKSPDPSSALKGKRNVFLGKGEGLVKINIYDFDMLHPGNLVSGPAIIETPITTIFIDIDQTGTADEYLNVIIQRREV